MRPVVFLFKYRSTGIRHWRNMYQNSTVSTIRRKSHIITIWQLFVYSQNRSGAKINGFVCVNKKNQIIIQMEDRIYSEKLCRICRENCQNVLNIFQEVHFDKRQRPADMLEHCLQQPLGTGNRFPITICTECTSKLISMYEFFVICEASEKYYSLIQKQHYQHQAVENVIEMKTELITCTSEPIELLEVAIKSEDKTEDILTNDGEKVRSKYYQCFICHRIYRRLKELRWHVKNHEKGTRGKLVLLLLLLLFNQNNEMTWICCNSTFEQNTLAKYAMNPFPV